jgi:hypothetical protein
MKQEETIQRMSIYFPVDLLERVRVSSRHNKRSFNKETLWLIEQALEKEEEQQKKQDQ